VSGNALLNRIIVNLLSPISSVSGAGYGRSRSCMSLSAYNNVLPRSTSGGDDRFWFRSDGGRVARFLLSSDDDDDEDDDVYVVERDDVVVQLMCGEG